MRKKKGQMEMMGLAIIVILLSLVLLFIVRFVIMREPTTYKKEYRESELAVNFLNALIETEAPDCAYTKFSTLFQDCASNWDNSGTGGNIPCRSGNVGVDIMSCEYVKTKLLYLFSRTFDEWNINYTFMMYTDPDDPENSQMFEGYDFTGMCAGDEWKVRTQPLPLDPTGDVYLALYICE